MNINYYPGHMVKAQNDIKSVIKLIDIVVEVLDARIPMSSRNPIVDDIAKEKQRIIVLNKADLADSEETKKWIKHFEENGITALSVDSSIPNEIKKIIDGSELKFTEGKQNYDFVYIDDVARAIRLILERGKNNNKYIIGSSSPRPLREYLEIINKTIAKDMLFQFGAVSYTGVNLPLSMFDCRNTQEDTGFKAEINFEDGIRKVYDSMR